MFGITGATGQLGGLVIKALMDKGVKPSEIVALVRCPEKAASCIPQGVWTRKFDYSSPSSDLYTALTGITRLLVISGSDIANRLAQHINIIEAAKQSKIELVAYTSVLHADSSPLLLAYDHKITEKALISSGLNYVLLRHGWYIENLFGHAHAPAVLAAAGDAKFNPVSRVDLAEADALALLKGEKNKILELAGDDSISYADIAKALSELSSKHMEYISKDPAEITKILVEMAHLPEGVAKALVDADLCMKKGALSDDSKALSSLIGHPTISVKQAFSSLFKQ